MKSPGPVVVVLGATALLVGVLQLGSGQSDHPLKVGAPAPEIALPFLDRPGDTLRLSGLRGKVVLLEMWNTACANCRSAMPAADALARTYGTDGFVVIHIANENLTDSAAMRRFLRETGVTGTVVVDDNRRFLSAYHVWGVPWSVLVDRQGRVAWQRPGVVNEAAHPLLTKAGEALLREVLGRAEAMGSPRCGPCARREKV